MDVSCPACAARYTANDEKLRGKTARMRCKACNNVWLVSGPSAEPKRAAVVKTGAEREKRDLFATGETDGAVKQTVLPPPTHHTGFTAVGARNENSVLFSLDQLTKTAQLEHAPATMKMPETAKLQQPAPSFRASDDEGVIDLKALSSVPPQRPIGLPVAPLFSEPVPMAFDVQNNTNTTSLRKTFSTGQLIGGIAAAAALILVAGLGIALTFRGEEPVKHSALPAALPPPVAPPVVVPPKTEPPPAPAASTADNTDTDAKEEAKAGKKGKGKKGRGGKAKGATATNVSSAPKPVKAADPCHCKGDFNCILACTAKGGR